MAILEQIPAPSIGQPGWHTAFLSMLARANTIPEIALDALAQKLIAGTGITVNYNSAAKALTLTATGATGVDYEALMDHIAAHLIIDSGGTLTYDDPAGDIHIAVTGGGGGGTSGPPRVVALTDGATITPNADTTDIASVTSAASGRRPFRLATPWLAAVDLPPRQDATGSRLIAPGAPYRFLGGTALTLTTTAAATLTTWGLCTSRLTSARLHRRERELDGHPSAHRCGHFVSTSSANKTMVSLATPPPAARSPALRRACRLTLGSATVALRPMWMLLGTLGEASRSPDLLVNATSERALNFHLLRRQPYQNSRSGTPYHNGLSWADPEHAYHHRVPRFTAGRARMLLRGRSIWTPTALAGPIAAYVTYSVPVTAEADPMFFDFFTGFEPIVEEGPAPATMVDATNQSFTDSRGLAGQYHVWGAGLSC
ncbi:MAG: hypothetical protein IPK85_03220 [Gemmatimonadetes bacterium]|nr:hypothetical protein [Gemmatimonadota bacterium]